MLYVLLIPVVFLSAVALDYSTARYCIAVTKRQRHIAASWSVAMAMLSLIGMVSALKYSLWFVIPEFLGLYVGTLIAIPKDDA